MARAGYERLTNDRSLRAINVQIQREEIDDYAESTGEPISRHFCDNNKSASGFGTKVRDDYLALIEAVKQGLVTEIIVTEIPRLSRESDDAGQFIRLSKATKLWSEHYNSGSFEAHRDAGQRRATGALHEFPRPHLAHCNAVMGFAIGCVELSGEKNVRAKMASCRALGSERCLTKIVWGDEPDPGTSSSDINSPGSSRP